MTRTIYVATDGSDRDGNGTVKEPFGSLDRAVQEIRNLTAAGLLKPVTVYIRGGCYERSEPLSLDERDSGTPECPVTYRAYPGEEVVITGGKAVTGWERMEDGIWRASYDLGYVPSTLYADGRRVLQARLPSVGYYETDTPTTPLHDHRLGITFKEGEAPELPVGDCRLSVFVWPGEGEWNWFSETRTAVHYDAANRYLSFGSPASWPIGEGSRFYIQGSLAFLRAPGQFCIDESQGYVYYWPADSSADPNEQTIIAPAIKRILQIQGSSPELPVSGITFSDLTFSCTDFFPEYRMMENNVERDKHREGLIYMRNAANIRIERCRLLQSGSCGIYLDRDAAGIRMDGNIIASFGHIGISLSGYAPGEGVFSGPAAADRNGHHAITNNYIEHGGELVGHGCGILLYQSGHNLIAHNRISHMPRYGISMKGLRYGEMPAEIYGLTVTWENHWDFLHTRDNLIAGNDISSVMEDSQDGGMIEAWGVGRGNIITNNDLHDSGIHFSFGFGIYLDDAADDFTVCNNVIRGLYSTGKGKLWMLIFSKGIGNRIFNNLLVDNPMAISGIGSQEMAGEQNKDIEIASNIVYNSGNLYYFVNYADERFASADRNLYWRNGEPCRIAGELPLAPKGPDELGRHVYEWSQWRTLREGSYDAASLCCDPLFVDRAAGDYRLQAESPAYSLGWQDIALGEFGPRQSYPV